MATSKSPPPKKKAPPAIAVSVDGVTHTVRTAEFTSIDTVALRRATGLSIRGLMQAAQDDPDIDVVAALVWLARRQAGERTLRFDTVAADINYETDVETAAAGPEVIDPET